MARWFVMIGLMAMMVGCSGRAQQQGGEVRIDFEKAEAHQVPQGFSTAVTNGPAGQWVVRSDAKSPAGGKVLVQENSDSTNSRFPLCIYDGLSKKDVEVSVAFKPMTGKVDQAAGIVVRYQDKDNYYIARANGLEDNVRLYKVEGGKRKQFAGVETKAPAANQWHTLTLKVVGNQFEVKMNDKTLFTASDDTFKTAGKVGLWTKADSVTAFDGLRIRTLDR